MSDESQQTWMPPSGARMAWDDAKAEEPSELAAMPGSPPFVELQRLQFGDSFVWDGRLWTLIDRDIDSGDDDCYIAREHHYGLTCSGAHDQFCRFPTTVAVRFVERSVPDWANSNYPSTS